VCRKNVLTVFFVWLALLPLAAWAQVNPVQQQSDSLRQNTPADTLVSDSLQTTADTVRMQAPRGDVETTVKYHADDSIIFEIPQREARLFGNTNIDYGAIKLEADLTKIDWGTNTLSASGRPDTTGKVAGKPLFTDGPQQYQTEEIRYNFKTRKAFITGIVTQQQEAFIHGETVKKGANDELFIGHARYTTCNLEHPHFYIEAQKLKVLPGDKVVAGPFHMKVADVSTPLGFLFGMFPAPKKRTSGIIVPTYGEERRRGFFLRDGGYYIAFNDYIDLAVTGEAYTKGSRGFQVASNYRKRYAYNGVFNLRYNRQNIGEESAELSEAVSKDFWVTWSHTPQSRGNSRFSASVNAGTSSYTQNNPSLNDIDRNINQQFNSNISYNKTFANTPFSMGLRANLVQDVRRKTVDLTLPELSVMMNRIYPFRPAGTSGKGPLRQLNFSYNMTGISQFSNKPVSGGATFNVLNADPAMADSVIAFNFDNADILLDRARMGVRHSIPVSTSFNVLKYFSVTPSFNYNELWYFKQLQYSDFDRELEGIRVDTLSGFTRAGSFNTAVGLSTKLYGTLYFNKKNKTPKVQAIRHMILPTLSFGYQPDFSDEKYGFFQNVITGYEADSITPIITPLSRFQGFAYGAPSSGEQQSMSFSIANNLEMKVRDKSDTTGTSYKKVPILERFNLSSSYNFVAEEFKLSTINISGNTRLLGNLISLNFGGRINPYVYELDSVYFNQEGERQVQQRLVDEFAWDNGQGIGKLESFNIGFNTSLSPSAFGKSSTQREDPNAATLPPAGQPGSQFGTEEEAVREELARTFYDDPNRYVDFTLPWTLRLNYTVAYTKRGYEESTIVQSARFSGDLRLTEKWKLGFSSGYDFENKDFTQTSLNIFRDLHCWQMNVSWIPFGRFQSFSVDINVKSRLLQDLKLSRRRTWFDN
jgi:lipopolysaccharide export system protein LptA